MPISRKPHPVEHKPIEPKRESQLVTSVRILPRLHARFEAYAKAQGLSKSAAINRLIEENID